MRRTLLAVGFAVLASLMIVPHVIISSYSRQRYVWRPFFMQGWAAYYGDHVMWGGLLLQTVFTCVLAALIVNIPRRRKKNDGAAPYPERERADHLGSSTSKSHARVFAAY